MKIQARAPRFHFVAMALALLVAILLKRYYSSASPEDLRWLLAPTTWLTQAVIHTDFSFRAGEGYLSREQSVLISPACAGLNFLVVAFLTLVLGFASRWTSAKQQLGWFVGALAAAFVSTVIVNAARIVLSIELCHLAVRYLSLTFHSVHRLIGIVVYLAGLLALCLTVQVWLRSRSPRPSDRHALLVALVCYAGVTLLVPLLRGAARNPEYWIHAAPVSVLVVVSAALLFAARGRTWDDGRHAVCSSEHPERVTSQQGSVG